MVSPCHLQAWTRPWLVGPGPRKPNEEVKTCGLPLSPPGLGPPLVGGPRTKEAECQGTRWDGGLVLLRLKGLGAHAGWRVSPGPTWESGYSQVSLMTLEVWRFDGRGGRSDGPGVLGPGQGRGS